MNSSPILWPVLAQILLTIVMYLVLAARKSRAVKAGLVDRRQAALDNRVWPADVVKVSNNIANQFETPVLFYVLCLLFHATGGVGTAVLVQAWAYVASRAAHALVHVGPNVVPRRTALFALGLLILLIMLVLAAWHLAQTAGS